MKDRAKGYAAILGLGLAVAVAVAVVLFGLYGLLIYLSDVAAS